MESHQGINQLAGVLQGRSKAVSEKAPVIDVGEIQGDMSLLTNKFPLPVPQSDYMVCRSVTWGKVGDMVDHILVGDSLRWLKAGDRVLVAWIDENDPCVIDVIYPATVIS